MASGLPERFRARILADALVSAGSTVVVGVSGRSDSVALLHLLHGLAPELRLRLVVAHLQAGESETARGDAAFVRQLAAKLDLEFDHYLSGSDLDAEKSAPKRELARYLAHAAQRTKAAAIATGETADDLAEELLAALVGDRVSDFGIRHSSFRWLQPLVVFTHDECLSYLQAQKLPLRQDPDALALTDARRKIRLLVLPLVRRHVESNVTLRLAAAAERLAADAAFLADLAVAARGEVSWQEADGRVSLDHARWSALPPSLRLRILADVVRTVVRNSQRSTFNSQLDALDAHCRSLTAEGTTRSGPLIITLDRGTLALSVVG